MTQVTLLSNAAAISEMLQEVELNEGKTKHAILAVGQAGNDMLRKADELKEITALVMDDNDKVVDIKISINVGDIIFTHLWFLLIL
jgi:predicted ribosome quality control (RQC) complex YloA/Tae2 family protein